MLERIVRPVFGVLSLIAIALFLWWNWGAAGDYTNGGKLRLRWYMSPREPIVAGTLMTSERLHPQIARVSSDLKLTPAAEIVGRYSLNKIAPGEVPQHQANAPGFSSLAAHVPPPGGAIVSVEVSTDHTVTLEPGMGIAFANEKVVVPGPKDLCRKHSHPLLLLAATSSPRDPKLTTLTVALPDCCVNLVSTLSSGQWRPVLLAPAASNGKPGPTAKPARAAKAKHS